MGVAEDVSSVRGERPFALERKRSFDGMMGVGGLRGGSSGEDAGWESSAGSSLSSSGTSSPTSPVPSIMRAGPKAGGEAGGGRGRGRGRGEGERMRRRVSWADMHGGRPLEQVTRFQGDPEPDVYYPFEPDAFERALSEMARVVPVPEEAEDEGEVLMTAAVAAGSEDPLGARGSGGRRTSGEAFLGLASSDSEDSESEGEREVGVVPELLRDLGWGAFQGAHIAQALEGLNGGASLRELGEDAWAFGDEEELDNEGGDVDGLYEGWGSGGSALALWPDFSGGLLGVGTLVTGTLVAFGAAGWWRARVLAQQLRAKEQELASALASLLISGRVVKGRARNILSR